MNKYAIIVAAGSGTRMGGEIPKQFQLLQDKPLLYHTLKTFLETYEELQVILVLPVDHTELGREIIDAYFDPARIIITAGGDTRFQSVKNGLQLVVNESIVFVHDGVRCLVTRELITRCFEKALKTGSAVPVVPSRDSIRIVTEEGNEALERERVFMVQTPQAFHSKILIPAFNIDFKDKFTDEATVVEAYGLKVSLVEGEEDNIKITRPADLLIAEKLLEKRNAALQG